MNPNNSGNDNSSRKIRINKQQVFVTVLRKTSVVNDKVINKYHSVNAQNYVRTINANMIRLEDDDDE